MAHPPALPAEPDIRARLIAVAARLLAEGGPEAVSVRRVATEVGASTMAVYTHFGSKPGLLRAVTLEGFRHLAARLAEVEPTDDPISDLARSLAAYRLSALDDPNLFKVMFGSPVAEALTDPGESEAALATFVNLVRGVERAMDAGRLAPGVADMVALELWSSVHGLCCIELGAGLATPDQAPRALAAAIRHLVIGLGDDPGAAARSIPDPTPTPVSRSS